MNVTNTFHPMPVRLKTSQQIEQRAATFFFLHAIPSSIKPIFIEIVQVLSKHF
jgi:hypothetical protein